MLASSAASARASTSTSTTSASAATTLAALRAALCSRLRAARARAPSRARRCGAAMAIDDRPPERIPTSRANAKSFSVSPPKRYSTATGISVVSEVMIDRVSVSWTERLTICAVGRAAHQRDVLPDAVEHDDHVVERIAQDGQQRRDGGARDLPPGDRVDGERQPDVVDHREQRRQRQLVLEPDRQVQDDDEEAER